MSNRSHLGHRARKRFGQNFLNDSLTIDRIVAAINPREGETLVEIGPGLGALTEPVADTAGHLNVVELDRDLAERLRHHPFLAPKLTIYEADAMKFDFSIIRGDSEQKLKVFGNLPYNISTPLMFRLFEQRDLIENMHFMLQKEVVERMVAGPDSRDYGKLSVMTQYYCQAMPVLVVGPEAFQPPPKVDSAVIRLIPREAEFPARSTKDLERVVSEAFSQRRKTLRNSLKKLIGADTIAELGIDPGCRPENVTLQQYVALANHYTEHGAIDAA